MVLFLPIFMLGRRWRSWFRSGGGFHPLLIFLFTLLGITFIGVRDAL
jgi:hypothetical protein